MARPHSDSATPQARTGGRRRTNTQHVTAAGKAEPGDFILIPQMQEPVKVAMDDLDHSVHIAERDWDSFYKESEECSLPQPELAGSDDLGLSDEEPEDSVCPVFPALGNVQDDPRQQNAAPNTAIPSEPSVKEEATLREDFICTDLPVKICESGSEETQLNDPLSLTEEEGGALLDSFFDNSPHAQKESDSGYYGENRGSGYFEENSLTTELVKDTPGETAEQNTEETSRNQNITKNLGSGPESSSNKCIANSDPSGACDVSDIKGFDGELPSEGGTGTLHDILTPLSLQPVPLPHQDLYPGQNISQEQLLCHTETAILCERHAIVAPREEKERWFVTVNESQAPHRVHAATAVKKKRRKKKTCRNSVPRGHHTSEGPDPPPESESEIDIDRMEESNRQETMNEFSTQSCNKSKPLPDTHTLPNNYHREVYIEFPKINVSYSELPPLFSELSSSSSISEDVNISTESPLQRDDSTEALDPESSIEENKQENYSSAVGLKRSVDHPLSKLQHLLLALHRSESVYSNEEGELFYTTSTSYDSEEEYVSATEMEDTNIPSSEIDSTLSASLPLQTPTANSQPLIQEDCLNCPLLSQREGYENTADQAYIESVRTCPSTGHSNSNPIMSEESSVPADSKHSPDSHMTNETPAHRAGEPLTVWEHLPQTNTSEDQPPLPLPEVTVTPTENPETSYNASDPTRPVYAISAFWDEMEKLTIKDILHLRVCRSPSPPKETLHPQESDSARVDVTVTDADMLNSSLTDIEEYYSQDSSLMDTSDTADSDYFTHNDDSPKPDRSSCEFSTFSDFDEEYMPFFGTSSIPSPELGNFERRRSESPCSGAISQEETDSSTGLATPVDCEELAALSSSSEDSIPNKDSISNTSLLPEATCLKGIRKSRSMLNIVQDLEVAQVETQLKDMHNAQALDVEKQLKDMCNVQAALEVHMQLKDVHNVQALEAEMQLKDVPIVQGLDIEMRPKDMRNAQALEVEMELKDMLEEAENSFFLNSCQDLDFAENPVLAVIDRISRMPSPILPNTDILDERYRITFPELYEYLFTEDVLSVYESLLSTSVAECCYDYSLSEYGAGVLFPPLVQQSLHGEGEPVHIFSCSRSAAQDLRSPELEDFLFPQQDTYLESEEDDRSPIRVVTRSDIQAKEAVSFSSSASAAPDGYPQNTHFYSQRGWTGNWKSLLSLRRNRFPGMGSTSSSWCWRSGAWMSPAVGQAQRALPPPITQCSQADTIVNEATRISPPPPEVIQLGHQIFRQLSEKQRRFKSLQTTVSVSKKDGILFSLKQSDMCLVCIAFASWVLRSADPMAADTWKAALLANVSAISAIQYLRRYVVKRREAGDLNDSTEDKA
ncbi:uncharacterized protein perm1b isoform X1 [Oncorhynchus kisutch]|uniref:uncharacterized protein perm1b isoform X1 n=1 Tax=Oncorhynchus kisutch TaxID=8019 RepID=UPI0009A077B0|nr:uncharacterized protein LOC109871199 isoform X1 [Oncorhynchus kisutch]